MSPSSTLLQSKTLPLTPNHRSFHCCTPHRRNSPSPTLISAIHMHRLRHHLLTFKPMAQKRTRRHHYLHLHFHPLADGSVLLQHLHHNALTLGVVQTPPPAVQLHLLVTAMSPILIEVCPNHHLLAILRVPWILTSKLSTPGTTLSPHSHTGKHFYLDTLHALGIREEIAALIGGIG